MRSAIEIERALGFQTAPETQPVQALRVEETTEISSSKEMQTASYKRSWTKYCSVWKPWSDVLT